MFRRKVFLGYFVLIATAAAQSEPELPRWAPAARMQTARVDHCAISMDDGRVFIAGGSGTDGPLSTVEIYGPGDEFAPGPPMSTARSGHSCTKLLDGRILVVGGSTAGGAEIFNPPTSSWFPVKGDIAARTGHTATLLPSGSVMLAGGSIGEQPSDRIEIYTPETESISRASVAMFERRSRHAAVALSDGRVLLIGGSNGQQVLTSNEIYDPVRGTVTRAAPLLLPRASHAAAVLVDGRVLVIGGDDGTGELGNAELYHEADDRMEWVASGLIVPVRNPFVTVIPARGVVLIAGGESEGKAIGTTQIFLPWMDRFVEVGSLTAPRTRIAGAALADGVIFATGGRNADGPSAACGVLIGPSISLSAVVGNTVLRTIGGARVLFPGQGVRANGQGFPPNVTVTLSLTRGRSVVAGVPASVTTDSLGRFQLDVYTATPSDIGQHFLLRATPASVTTITDGSSNTIMIGETTAVQASFDVKAATTITARNTVSSVISGAIVPVEVTIGAPPSDGSVNPISTTPITGTVTVNVGFASASFSVPNVQPNSPFTVNFCCAGAPGSYNVTASYSGDNNYAGAGLVFAVGQQIPTVTVVSNQVSIGLSAAAFPLFTNTQPVVQVRAPAQGLPVPTGSVTVTQATGIPPAPMTLALTRDFRSLTLPGALAGFSFKATFVDKPTACFRIDYSGDSVYPPLSNPSVCIPVTPAVPSLEIIAATTDYTFGTPFPFTLRLTFPQEIGLVGRTVRVNPPGLDFSLQVGLGVATANVSLGLPFGEQAIDALYNASGDLARARGFLSIRMLPAVTKTLLTPITSPATNPLTLRATVSSVIPVGKTSAGTTPVPSGTVQFFDGSLIIGQVQATANADGSAIALLNYNSPVGVRPIKAVYLGNTQFSGSTSDVLSVTLK